MKFAFTLSCTGGYLFGMISAMNAMAHFGVRADWEVAYANIPQEMRDKISSSFPFKVNWTFIPELIENTNKIADRHWIATWLMTKKVINNYDAICHTQADHMPLSNMTSLFKAAASGCLVLTEHFNYSATIEDLYAGNAPITDRGQCALTDQFIFANSKYKNIFSTVAETMDQKLEGDRNHPVIILNNAVKENVPFEDVITLERHIWAFQKNLNKIPLRRSGNNILTNNDVRLRGIHNRWWQRGRANSELKNNPGKDMSITIANWNLIRDYMAEFNAMRPEIAVEDYERTVW